MRYVFIINPTAGKVNSFLEVSNLINDYFGNTDYKYKILKTEKKGDGKLLAQKEANEGDEVTIFSVGGEGTTFEVINGIAGYDNVTLGIIPHGTGNDFVKFFKNKDAFLDLKDQIQGESVKLDAIKFEDMYLIDQCCCGMDAMVASNVGKFRKFANGILAYNLSIVYTIFKKYKAKLKIKVDGKTLPITRSLFMTCANAPYYGGGYYSAPTANPTDGKITYSIIKTASKLKALTVLGSYKKGLHMGKTYCEYGKCDTFEISSDTEMPIVLDGEIFYRKNVKLSIVPKMFNFNIPKSLLKQFGENKEKITI